MIAVSRDPRPGLTEWLADHWPPSLVWAAPWLRPLARWHQRCHGRDATDSACLLASVTSWDVWDESRGPFENLVLTVAGQQLAWETRRDRRLRAGGWLPPLPLEGWAVIDRTDHTAEVADRELVERAMRERHRDTLAAVADEYTLVDAARRLGVSRETVRRRLLEVRALLLPAEPDVDETPRPDVIVTE